MIDTILVDDEVKAIDTMRMLLQRFCPEVNLVGAATNALDAVRLIMDRKPRLVFLDVQMPGFTGFDVLESIRGLDVTVVFVTAHRDYAINAIRKGAFDYLLKPVDPEELRICVERVRESAGNQHQAPGMIGLSVKDGIIFVRPADIVRLEAAGSYTLFCLENKVRHMVSRTMKEYEALLDPEIFFRCHNSHIVNLTKVVKFLHTNGYYAEMSNGAVVEIARRNKDVFLERLKALKV